MKAKFAKVIPLFLSLAVVLSLSVPAFALSAIHPRAATFDIDLVLPAKRGDAETDLVTKSTDTSYFYVDVNLPDDTRLKAVNVWTENQFGYNFSSPYHQLQVGYWEDISYDIAVPKVGDSVKLNMDNPVSVDYTVAVTGQWTPF